jgi:hypothetical protein
VGFREPLELRALMGRGLKAPTIERRERNENLRIIPVFERFETLIA